MSSVAKDVTEFYGSRLSEVLFILPNKRAASRFQLELAKQQVVSIWSPEIIAINDFFQKASGLRLMGELETYVLLHQAVSQYWQKAGSLADFIQWGDLLIRDFEEVDKYLVDVHRLYSQLSDEKEIETRFSILDQEEIRLFRRFWSGMHAEMSPIQQEWLSLWNQMEFIYNCFTGLQEERNLGGIGLMYRRLAEQCRRNEFVFQGYKGVVFIGFNALTQAEEVLFKSASQQLLGRYYWDPDPLIEKLIQKFPMSARFLDLLRLESDRYSSDEQSDYKRIKLYSFEGSMAQTKMVPSWLNELCSAYKEGLITKSTAIVLGEEGMLDELIWAIENKGLEVNVSIGRSVLNTRVGAWLYKVVSALSKEHSVGLNQMSIPDDLWTEFASHPESPQSWKKMVDFLQKEGVEDASQTQALESRSLKMLAAFFDELGGLIRRHPGRVGPEVWYPFFIRWLKASKIPFPAKPHAQIQLTGILETRVLDFEQLILLTVNEGVWPSNSSQASFIPFHLRKEFGLPVPDSRDAMYGYHFFRLLKRARQVLIGYLALGDTLTKGIGEKSRFLLQLEYERNQLVDNYQVTASYGTGLSDPPVIPKTGKVGALLAKYMRGKGAEVKSLSPSALNTFIDCPLRFVYQNLLSLRDPAELNDLSEPRLFGTFLHEVMEFIYTQHIPDGRISVTDLDNLLEQENLVYEILLRVLAENRNKSFGMIQVQNLKSKDLMVLRVVQNYILRILKTDRAYAPFQVIGSEKRVEKEFELFVGGEPVSVLLGGIIDRIDQKGNQIRVIDYKSGQPSQTFKDFSELIDASKEHRPKEIFQALFYSYLLSLDVGADVAVMPGLYALRQMKDGLLDSDLYLNKQLLIHQDQYGEATKELIQSVLADLFNPEMDFQPTDNLNNCRYCTFKQNCQRV